MNENLYINKKRRKKRAYKSYLNKVLSVFSCNAANVKNKLFSLEKNVNDLNLSLFCLQETHMNREGLIKFKNSSNFQIYEKNRNDKSGGGLAIGVLKELNPAWIRDGEDKVEAMTITISVQNLKIYVVNAYGPQEYDAYDKKNAFWRYLDNEIMNCNMDGSCLMICMDSNAWLGPSLIQNDPHPQNKNGQLFNQFLLRNPQMSLLNSSDICEGLIT